MGKTILGLTALALTLMATGVRAETAPSFKKVMTVIFENTNYDATMRQPFFKRLAAEGASLTRMHAETHPSQPNYMALVAGDTMGVSSDANVTVSGENIVDLLEKTGKSWKVYAEAYGGDCDLSKRDGTYVKKHQPLISFRNVQKNAKRCAQIVNSDQLQTDLAGGNLPDYSLFIPDLNDDGHDTSVAYADQWFSGAFGPLLKDPRFADVLLMVTFDEDDYAEGNHIYTVLYGKSVKPGSTSDGDYNHYSLLRTVEDVFGLGTLGRNDDDATAVTGIWK